MNIPTITDSRGNKSSTLFFVALALTVLLARFIAGIFSELEQMDVVSFATAFTTIIAPWIVREGVDKVVPSPDDIKLPPGA